MSLLNGTYSYKPQPVHTNSMIPQATVRKEKVRMLQPSCCIFIEVKEVDFAMLTAKLKLSADKLELELRQQKHWQQHGQHLQCSISCADIPYLAVHNFRCWLKKTTNPSASNNVFFPIDKTVDVIKSDSLAWFFSFQPPKHFFYQTETIQTIKQRIISMLSKWGYRTDTFVQL